MDPAALVPAADAIPVAWGWFEALSLVTFAAHLLVMNALLGGGLVGMVALARGQVAPSHFAAKLPTALAFTVNLGVPALLFLQVLYGQFLYTASILSAVYWLAVVGLVLAAYYLLYAFAYHHRREGWPRVGNLGLASLLLLAVSFIMANLMTLMLRPAAWTAYFKDPTGWLLNLGDPTLLPRWLHFVLASLAVGGLGLALLNRRAAAGGDAEAQARLELGLRWFTRATLVQMAAGVWFLLALPPEIMLGFLGGDALATAVFLAALALAALSLAYGLKGRPLAAAASLAATVLAMVGVRDLLRRACLAPFFLPERLAVTGQYGPLVMFLLSLAGGLALVAYLLRLARRAGREA